MITLYGFALSNYYNKVKFALLEKAIPFQEVMTPPSQAPEILSHSPVGKIPFIQTENGGYLSESQAILEYLEDTYQDIPLYPQDNFERAKCREFIQQIEQNVELFARRLYGEVLFGSPVSDEIKQEVKTKLDTNLKNISALFKFSPFVMGEHFTAADIVAWPHLQLVGYVTEKMYGENLVSAHIPGVENYIKTIESRPHAQKVGTERAAAIDAFFNKK
ncbi:MAG: glutathione S-transferase [Methylobacter sp.]|nr:MAG: glutathione S-transferase [Methylobacter sp.]PPD17775.1 MAG: glutathione S-transferase [Methylobacter sp.]